MRGLNKLIYVDIDNNQISDLSPLADCKSLHTLSASENKIASLEPLCDLKEIDSIYIGDNELTSLSGIENCTKITIIVAPKNNIITVEPVEKLSILELLNVDENQITDLSPIRNCVSTRSLYISNNKITNIEPIKNLTEIYYLDLSYNPITNVEEISSNRSVIDLSLDGIKIQDLNFLANYSNLRIISLKDCDIGNASVLKTLNLTSVDLSGNKNLDLSTVPLEMVGNPGSIEGRKLILEDCNIRDCNILKDYNGDILILNYNPIEDITALADLECNLYLDYTNIKDVSSLKQIIELSVSGNKGLTGIEQLTQLWSLKMKDCDIGDISFLSNLSNLAYIDLSDNKICNIDGLQVRTVIDNNKLGNISEDLISNDLIYSANNQQYVQNFIVPINETSTIEFPTILKYGSELIPNNCEIDKERKEITIKPTKSEVGIATVTVDGGIFDKSIYTISYATNDITGIKITHESNLKDYMEGENFDATGMVVEIIHADGTLEPTTNYVIPDGKKLSKATKEVTIQCGTFEVKQPINVWTEDEATIIKFNDSMLYSKVLKNVQDYIKNKNISTDEILSNYDKVLVLKKSLQQQITELNISLGEQEEKIKDLAGLSKFENLTKIALDNIGMENFEELEYLIKLEELVINENNNEVDIGTMLDKENISKVIINNSIKAEKGKESIILPQYMQAIAIKQGEDKLEGEIKYSKNGESKPISITKNADGKLEVKLDKEISEEKPEIKRTIEINVNGGVANSSTCTIEYIIEEDLKIIDIIDKKYIVSLNKNNNTFTNIFNYNNFPKQGSYVIKNSKEEVVDESYNLETGSKIEIQDNNQITTYYISLRGDVDKNAKIELGDISTLAKLVFDQNSKYEWEDCVKIAGNCDTTEYSAQEPNLYDIMRLVEYYFDNKKW